MGAVRSVGPGDPEAHAGRLGGRAEDEMPARKEEVKHAKEEGVVLRTLTNPVGA